MKTFITILFLLPSLVWADHTDLHDNTQALQEMTATFSGAEMVDILIVLFFITGVMSGQR
ncbi:MAG: hypothetical protein H8E32_05360 [Nitrospinae bacterium]|nr:hypothetical protein [Nitrospinota bacterium]